MGLTYHTPTGADATFNEADDGAVWALEAENLYKAKTHQVTIQNVDCTGGTLSLFIIPLGYTASEAVAVKDENGAAITVNLATMSTTVCYVFEASAEKIAVASSGTDGDCKIIASGW